jgi:serine protease AprX
MTSPLLLVTVSILVIPTVDLQAETVRTVPEDTIAVWVFFTDKPEDRVHAPPVSKRTFVRRKAAGYKPFSDEDFPVSVNYIRSVERNGGTLRHLFTWGNAASFDLPVKNISTVKAFPFVYNVIPVRRICTSLSTSIASPLGKRHSTDSLFGTAFEQLSTLKIPQALEYLDFMSPESVPGQGVRIAFFDSGFRLHHRCFNHLLERNTVIGTWDFVDNDETVEDPDSVTVNPDHPYYGNDLHGSEVFSIVAAYDPPYYTGVAWGADFLLARTENTYFDSTLGSRGEYIELHSEEDNWAAAVVWAESLGVDIISSSVGYNTGFLDTIIIEQPDGTFDTIQDYAKADMDGRTSIISRAAQGAIDRGVIIVNAAGNDGSYGYEGDTTLTAPADVEKVISVGLVKRDGQPSLYPGSKGPNAVGMLKPDLSAPGYNVYLPDIYHYNDSLYNAYAQGTSLATPFISGICALMLQSHPEITPDSLRKKLYRFCTNPRGVPFDYRLGRGVPDACKSIMGENEIYLHARDTSGMALLDATVTTLSGDSIGTTGTLGQCIVRHPHPSENAVILTRGEKQRTVTADALPFYRTLYPCSLEVTVRDSRMQTVPLCSLFISTDNSTFTTATDSTGKALITDFFHLDLGITAAATGYRHSKLLEIGLNDQKQVRALLLEPQDDTTLNLWPNILRRDNAGKLTIQLILPASSDEGILHASVRTLNGNIIWNKRITASVPETIFSWNGRNRNGQAVSPGMYYVFVSFAKKKIRRKVIIL